MTSLVWKKVSTVTNLEPTMHNRAGDWQPNSRQCTSLTTFTCASYAPPSLGLWLGNIYGGSPSIGISLFTPKYFLSLFKIWLDWASPRASISNYRQTWRSALPKLVRLLHSSMQLVSCLVLWLLLTSWLIENESIPRPPLVRAFSFLQCLRHLLFNECSVWTLQWCACLSSLNSLICRSCSSVPDFAVSLPSVHTSR